MNLKKLAGALFVGAISLSAYATNPLMTQKYTADPQAFVYNGRVYIICSHDLPNQRGYDLYDYVLMSSDDMQNWTDHGLVFSVKRDAPWAGHAYAPGIAIRDKKIYLYFPDGGASIGVAVAEQPEGPYVDPLKKTMISNRVPSYRSNWLFDPAGFVDDDGKAFVYYGGNGNDQARILEVKPDMITPVSDQAVHHTVPRFFEASYMHKYKGKYYFSYSTNFNGQPAASIDYMIGDTPIGPFTHKGTILRNPPDNMGNNNHASVIEFNGKWYVAYHNRRLAQESKLQNPVNSRSVNIDEMFYNEDGTIKEVVTTKTGPKQLKNVDPKAKNLFVTMNRQDGTDTLLITEKGTYIAADSKEVPIPNAKATPGAKRYTVLGNLKNNAWTKVTGVDFSGNPKTMTVNYSAEKDGTVLEIHQGAPDGKLLGSTTLKSTDGLVNWKETEVSLQAVSDSNKVIDLCFVFKAPNGAEKCTATFNWYQCK